MPIETHNPSTVHQPGPYTHLVTITGGRLLVLAGQVALDRDGKLVGKDDLRAQTQQVLENIKAILAAAGADFSNVVKLTIYVVDYQPAQRQPIIDTLSAYFDMTSPPANTLLGVQSLAREELLIEIDVLASVD
ncbi:MAG: RidA family protein [Chloroflexi bacterium]|nr:RidA family protein [Chloroflexota bacterium]